MPTTKLNCQFPVSPSPDRLLICLLRQIQTLMVIFESNFDAPARCYLTHIFPNKSGYLMFGFSTQIAIQLREKLSQLSRSPDAASILVTNCCLCINHCCLYVTFRGHQFDSYRYTHNCSERLRDIKAIQVVALSSSSSSSSSSRRKSFFASLP